MCGVRRLRTPQSLPQQVAVGWTADVQAWSLAASGVFGQGSADAGVRRRGTAHRAPGRGPTSASARAGRGPITCAGLSSWAGACHFHAIGARLAEHSNVLAAHFRVPTFPLPPPPSPSLCLLTTTTPSSSPTHINSNVQRTRSFPGRGRPGRAVVEGVCSRVPLIALGPYGRAVCRTLASHKPSGRTPRHRSCRSAARCPSPTLRTCRQRSSSA